MKFKHSLRYLAALTLVATAAACSPSAPTSATAASGASAASAPASGASAAATGEAAIRQNLMERLPQFPPITAVRETPFKGLYEVHLDGKDILYTSDNGDFVIQGILLDTKNRQNLTEESMIALHSVPFEQLPLNDAIVTKKGDGSRKLAIFADPNCGFCKRFEKELEKVDNITVYTFLYPILGADSNVKAKNIWCAKDKSKTMHDWMLNDVTPPIAQCDTTAIDRNIAFGHANNIQGTPALLFANGRRVSGFVEAAELEELLKAAAEAPTSAPAPAASEAASTAPAASTAAPVASTPASAASAQ